MKVSSFILCESAKLHKDGTFDVQRGAMGSVRASVYPAKVSLSTVLLLESEPGEEGRQRVEILLRDANGKRLETWRYEFRLEAAQHAANLVLNLREARIPAAGDYFLDLKVNGRHAEPTRTLRAGN